MADCNETIRELEAFLDGALSEDGHQCNPRPPRGLHRLLAGLRLPRRAAHRDRRKVPQRRDAAGPALANRAVLQRRLRRRRPHRLSPSTESDKVHGVATGAGYAGRHDSGHLPLLARRHPARRLDPRCRRPDRWLPEEGHRNAVPLRSATAKSNRAASWPPQSRRSTGDAPSRSPRASPVATPSRPCGGQSAHRGRRSVGNDPAAGGSDRVDHGPAITCRPGRRRRHRSTDVDPGQHRLVPTPARAAARGVVGEDPLQRSSRRHRSTVGRRRARRAPGLDERSRARPVRPVGRSRRRRRRGVHGRPQPRLVGEAVRFRSRTSSAPGCCSTS